MNEPTPNHLKHLNARVTGLEEILTHFERALGELDEVLRHIQTRMDTLESRFDNLTGNVERMAAPPAEERSAEDERPPHY
jgi:SlyX protein